MKTMDLLTLLGELDEGAISSSALEQTKRTKRRPLWGAVAACLCACMLGFSAWFFLPPMVITSNVLEITTLRIDSRLACYRVVETERMSPFEKTMLPDTPGEVLCTHGDTTFYTIQGASDLYYLLGKGTEGYILYEFDHFTSLVGVDMAESVWYDMGWLTDEDLAAFDCETVPSMGEILTLIYGVTSAEDVVSIRFDKSPAYRGGITKKVKVPPVTVKETKELERLYALIAAMAPIPFDERDTVDLGSVDVHDADYLEGRVPLSAQVNRRVTVTLESSRTLILYYYPATGLLRQGSEQYTVLSTADNQWLTALAEIDMAWRDWGTEKEHGYGGEGDETATIPAVLDPQ